MRCLPLILAVAGASSALADPVPPPEVAVSDVKVDLPALPSFGVPAVVDGVHGARELRVAGAKLLGSDLKVSGYVVWVYDCTTAVAKAGETRVQTQTRVDADPTLCQRPRFYLGEAKDTPVESALWVVEVPRLPNKLERERLPKADLAKWPAVPKIAVGDFVTVSGKFAVTAPHGDRNSDGLIVFAGVAPAKPGAAQSIPVVIAAPPALAPVQPRAKKPTNVKTQNESADHLNAANKLASAGKLDEAIAEYEKSTAAWPDDHLAWYGLGGIHAARGAWDKAAAAFEEAVAIRPDVAVYQMWRGVVAYEQDAAHADTASFDRATEALRRALALAPKMWRAHYYLGKIERAQGRAQRAAEEFTATIQANPIEAGPYVALAELYRKWDAIDAAIAVATQGTTNVPKSADLWYVLGMALERKDQAKAIEAFTKSIAAGKAPPTAVYERGRMELAMKDFASAKKDLEAYVRSAGDKASFQLEIANQLLGQIPAKH